MIRPYSLRRPFSFSLAIFFFFYWDDISFSLVLVLRFNSHTQDKWLFFFKYLNASSMWRTKPLHLFIYHIFDEQQLSLPVNRHRCYWLTEMIAFFIHISIETLLIGCKFSIAIMSKVRFEASLMWLDAYFYLQL